MPDSLTAPSSTALGSAGVLTPGTDFVSLEFIRMGKSLTICEQKFDFCVQYKLDRVARLNEVPSFYVYVTLTIKAINLIFT